MSRTSSSTTWKKMLLTHTRPSSFLVVNCYLCTILICICTLVFASLWTSTHPQTLAGPSSWLSFVKVRILSWDSYFLDSYWVWNPRFSWQAVVVIRLGPQPCPEHTSCITHSATLFSFVCLTSQLFSPYPSTGLWRLRTRDVAFSFYL